MEITNEIIYNEVMNVKLMLQTILKVSKSDKLKILEEETKLKKRLAVGQAQSLLGGISRPWALDLMKRVGKELHYRFIPGDKALKRPSILTYNETEATKETYENIKNFVLERGFVTLADICLIIDLNVATGLERAREIAENIVKTDKSYYFDSPKLFRKA